MRVKVPFNWRQASSAKFNQDAVRREGLPYRKKRLKGFISKKSESDMNVVKQWIEDNGIVLKRLLGVFIVHPDHVYYDGVALEFTNDDDMLMFKLRFD